MNSNLLKCGCFFGEENIMAVFLSFANNVGLDSIGELKDVEKIEICKQCRSWGCQSGIVKVFPNSLEFNMAMDLIVSNSRNRNGIRSFKFREESVIKKFNEILKISEKKQLLKEKINSLKDSHE